MDVDDDSNIGSNELEMDEGSKVLLPCFNLIEAEQLSFMISNGFCMCCKKRHEINEDYIKDNSLNETTVKKIYNRFLDNMNYLKELIQDPSTYVKTYIDNIRDEIDIRIESIKIELDEIREEMFNDLNNWKFKLENNVKKFIEQENHELRKHEEFFKDITNKMDNFKENFQDLIFDVDETLEHYNETSELLSKIKNVQSKIVFKTNDLWKPYHDIVGKFDGELLFAKRLKEKPIQKHYIGLEIRNATNIASLNESELYIADANSNISVLDNALRYINSVNTIDRIRFNFPGGMSTDNQEKLFICNSVQSKIYTVDRYLKRVISCFGKFGSGVGEFDNPKDVLYLNGFLFVLDSNNYRIQKFTEKGDFKSIITLFKSNDGNEKLNNPSKMAIMDDVIAVLDESKYIYLYNFNGKIIQVLDLSEYGYIQSFCFANDYLMIHCAHGWLLAYEKVSNGTLKKYFERQHDDLKEFSEEMTYFKDKLIILYRYENSLLVF